jgi:nucleoside-diphosphate-sugar epimerase
MNKKILIVGNLGYIGSVLSRHIKLKYKKDLLIGLDSGLFKKCFFGKKKFKDTYIDLQLFGDVRNFDYKILNNIDHVIYLAAVSNDPMGSKFINPTLDINFKSAIKLAKKCKVNSVKTFTFASSCSMYGFKNNLKNENSKLFPLTPYAQSKILAENQLKKISSKNFRVFSLRFGTACGVSPRFRLDLVLNDFVTNAIVNKKIEILSRGDSWRPLIDVSDMCRAIEWSFVNKIKKNFIAVNVGHSKCNYQIKDLAFAVKKYLPKTKIYINSDNPPDKRSYKVNFNLYKKIARGYLPIMKINDTVKETIRFVKKSKYSDKNFRNSDYIRLNYLKKMINKNKLNKNLFFIN